MFVTQPCRFTYSWSELWSTLTPTLRAALIRKTGDPTIMSSDPKTMKQWQNVTAWRWGSDRLDPQPGHNKNTASGETACPVVRSRSTGLYRCRGSGGAADHIEMRLKYWSNTGTRGIFYFCLTWISDKTTCYALVTSELYQTLYILQIVVVLLHVAFCVSIIILVIITVNILQFMSALISRYFG